MTTPGRVSNFQEFQKVLKRGRLSIVPEDSAPAPKNGATVVEHHTTNSEGSETPSYDDNTSYPVQEDFNQGSYPVLLSLRQTTQWDEKSRRNVEYQDIPNEDWTTWKSRDHNEEPRAWVIHHKVIDKLGMKMMDKLVIRGRASDLKFFQEVNEEVYSSLSKEEPDSTLTFPYTDYPYEIAQSLIIDEESFKDLFFQSEAIAHKIEIMAPSKFREILQAVLGFINHIFPGAQKAYHDALRIGQIPFSHVWTLFRLGDIVYEKRVIPPFHYTYEQCFSIHKAEEFVSQYDSTKVLRLSLTEIIYRPSRSNKPGPRMVRTTRHIRKYDGLKGITAEDLGIIPFNMVPLEERTAIEARLTQRGRQFLQLSMLPFSFWNYNGPYGIVHPIVGAGTMEETRLCSRERQWQKHTHENVVIDLATSSQHFDLRFTGWLNSFHDTEYNREEELPTMIPDIDITNHPGDGDSSNTERSLLICRGYLPGYLLSSGVYAIGILISELREPIWKPWNQSELRALFIPDITSWCALIHAFLEGGQDSEALLGRRRAQGSGLVLSLEGPKIVTETMANQVSVEVEKPLVAFSPLDNCQSLEEVTKAAVRWGAILLVDMRNIPTEQRSSRGLHLGAIASFYPSVMLISCNSTDELGDYCEGIIDGVIKCTLPSKEQPVALWRVHLAQHSSDLLKGISDQQLSEMYTLLAQIETRESRMEKIISTAERLAIAEKARFTFRHVLFVIRSSVSPNELQKFDDMVTGTISELK